MNVIDLSHPFSEDMPVYPGTESPEIVEACTITGHGFAEKRLRLFSHTGTHLDAPAHILSGAVTLDRL
jgi:arylformamidase